MLCMNTAAMEDVKGRVSLFVSEQKEKSAVQWKLYNTFSPAVPVVANFFATASATTVASTVH